MVGTTGFLPTLHYEGLEVRREIGGEQPQGPYHVQFFFSFIFFLILFYDGFPCVGEELWACGV